MNEFERYHPLVNFVYFIFVIGYAAFFMHPLCLAVSFVCGGIYSLMLKKSLSAVLIAVVITAAVINPAFNHEGATILGYLPGGNPFTLESVIYGLAAGIMLANVICWFSCCGEVITSDKFIYLFGRIIPSLSLILSMTLRFVPEFAARAKIVSQAQRCIGRDMSEGNIIKRMKCGIAVLSAMITWSLENSLETADSMKSRGYGLKGRTSFSIFKFDVRDRAAFIFIAVLGIYVFIGAAAGQTEFRYFPSVYGGDMSAFGASVFAAYFLLCAFPAFLDSGIVNRPVR